MADHAVDVIGKIKRGGARRQVDDIPFRGEDVDSVLEHLTAQVFEQGAALGEIFLPGEQLAQPLDLVFEGVGLAACLCPFLVAPVRRDAEFGILMHLVGTDLDLDGLAFRPHHYGVDRLIAVGFGVGDIVVKLARNVVELGMHDTERRIAILQPLGHYPHRASNNSLNSRCFFCILRQML